MPWQELTAPKIQRFIKENEAADAAQLALRKLPVPDHLKTAVLGQIKARQKAKTRIPGWYGTENIIWPAPDMMEQCSSQAAALYKASLVKGALFADLTGGAGIDSVALAQNFTRGLCVEQDADSAALLAHNLPLVSKTPIAVFHARAEDFIPDMPEIDLVYLDPQRRDGNRKGIYNLEDCRPNVLALLPLLTKKAKAVLIKASPVLDIDRTVEALPGISQVHVIEWRGECKEALYLIRPGQAKTVPEIIAVSIDDDGRPHKALRFTRDEETAAAAEFSAPQAYIYEPSPAFMKAGCFNLLAARYGLKKLHPNTHLYTGEALVRDFPGRIFRLFEIMPADKKAVARALPDKKANISVRNFPASPEDLRKKLGLRDGGDEYLFACTTMENRHVLLRLHKT